MKTKDERKRIALVDDNPAVLASVEAGLGKVFNIVAKCVSGEEALEVLPSLAPDQRPHLVLLDIRMPGMGGIACCRELRRQFPKLVIVMHTAKSSREWFEDARQAGADAYIMKGCLSMDELAAALQDLKRRKGQCLCVAGTEPRKPADHASPALTSRETQVMDFISQGEAYKQAADHFGCSVSNIKKTVARAIRHLRARSKDHAIRLWLEGV